MCVRSESETAIRYTIGNASIHMDAENRSTTIAGGASVLTFRIVAREVLLFLSRAWDGSLVWTGVQEDALTFDRKSDAERFGRNHLTVDGWVVE